MLKTSTARIGLIFCGLVVLLSTATLGPERTVEAQSVASITLTPAILPDAMVGVRYFQTLTASTTADGPFAWSVSSGNLPLGIALISDSSSGNKTATLSGIPIAPGVSIFTLQVSNGTSGVLQQYTLAVTSAGISPIITPSSSSSQSIQSMVSSPATNTAISPNQSFFSDVLRITDARRMTTQDLLQMVNRTITTVSVGLASLNGSNERNVTVHVRLLRPDGTIAAETAYLGEDILNGSPRYYSLTPAALSSGASGNYTLAIFVDMSDGTRLASFPAVGTVGGL